MSNLIEKMDNAYTQNGWRGKMYDSSLSTKDIAERIRHFCKKQYPDCKFSITKRDSRAIELSLMVAPFEVFEKPDIEKAQFTRSIHTPEECVRYWQMVIDKGHHTVNEYYINEDICLNARGKEIMQFLKDCTLVYNYDDSDAQTDYFNTNFYITLSIGKWDKPFIIKK